MTACWETALGRACAQRLGELMSMSVNKVAEDQRLIVGKFQFCKWVESTNSTN